MTYETFLARTVDDGIAAARADYQAPAQARLLAGSVDGFEACRGKLPVELLDLYNRAAAARRDQPRRGGDPEYWIGYLAEVEWTCNVVSAVLISEGDPPLLAWLPTARGMLKAAEILGVVVPDAPDRVAS